MRHRTLFKAKLVMKRMFCLSSRSLKDSRLKVDIVVNAPSTPTARNRRLVLDKARDFSPAYVTKLRMKAPRILTPRVPSGNLAEPCRELDSRKLKTAPMKPPIPT